MQRETHIQFNLPPHAGVSQEHVIGTESGIYDIIKLSLIISFIVLHLNKLFFFNTGAERSSYDSADRHFFELADQCSSSD